ncbi:hypothetical protein B0A48_06344 [Cryoendolithus antarcticus]|uniref:DNA repair protein rhp7 treble clef domain-containing protein n=1 Tax=Cryoendolithus antarcticus TaxID=1507870 RepID=A0A1V8TB19_9PEZI|nr:hypothetical protein B0A48_06344 [Cryoendolithus antarcticus]
MSGRRNGNRIRGPQSALTDFLAANNISAAQIRDDHERRQREARNNGEGSSTAAGAEATPAIGEDGADEDVVERDEEEEERVRVESKKRKRKGEVEALEKIKKAKAGKGKGKEEKGKWKGKGKGKAQGKKGKKGDPDEDDDDGDSDDDFDPDDLGRDMYKKSRPLPGQFEHCEICSKRFTVTPYNIEGPDGGLVCTPCGKELKKDVKAEKKSAAKQPQGRKRRKLESDRLDGLVNRGAKSLQQMCIETVAKHHDDVEELGDMPAPLVERLSQIFSKQRVLKPKTLPLFLRPDLQSVVLHDAAYLEADDYKQIFAVVPNVQKLVLGNTCQMKDEAMEYMLERCLKLKHVQLYASNLVSTEMWEKFFTVMGGRLESLALKWLDNALEDESVEIMARECRNVRRLKFKLCRRLGERAVVAIATLPKLQHLSLQLSRDVSNEALISLVEQRGPKLLTLSLEKFLDADETLLSAIHDHCRSLQKLRVSENDTVTDAAFTSLFTAWPNPPLVFADFNATRDIDNNNSDGPLEDPIGLGSAGFTALMAHSGQALKHLDISSCRHIDIVALSEAFCSPDAVYPALEYINVSFCSRVDTEVVEGIFKACPALKKLVAFGCFDVGAVRVPGSVVLIGVPRAREGIEQFGGYFDGGGEGMQGLEIGGMAVEVSA